MDKETLSNYGWIVICVLVLAVMIALAGPFGTFVAGAVKSTTAGLFGVNQNALGAAGIEIEDQAFANCEHLETEIRNATADYSGDTCCKECGAILGTGTYVIPEGGKYTAADGTVYNPGDGYPETVTAGDVYTTNNYEYRYYVENNTYGTGWHVKCTKDIADPGPILSSVNGEPVVSMRSTFSGRKNLTVAPVIPNTVTDMYYAFGGCKSLVIAPEIPNSVTSLYQTFSDCTSLTTAPVIPSSVTNLDVTFGGCTSLTGTVTINTTPPWGKYGLTFRDVDMSKITLAGSCPQSIKREMANSGINGSQVTIID